MITYYIHQENTRHQRMVSRIVGMGRKERLCTAFILDCPGSPYCDGEEWNVHVDGCDYAFKNYEEALYYGLGSVNCIYNHALQQYSSPEYRVVEVPFSYEITNEKALLDELKRY